MQNPVVIRATPKVMSFSLILNHIFPSRRIIHRAYLKCGFSLFSNKSARTHLRRKHQPRPQLTSVKSDNPCSILSLPASPSGWPYARSRCKKSQQTSPDINPSHNSPSDSPSCTPPNTPPTPPPAPQSTQSWPRSPTDNAAPRG